MLNDNRTRVLVDYTDSKVCFPGVDIAGGICYFLWDRDHRGECTIKNFVGGKEQDSVRPLDEFNTFIRYSEAVDIVKKVRSLQEGTMDTQVSSRKPFGLDTTVSFDEQGDLTLRSSKGLGKYKLSNVSAGRDLIDKWKTIISYVSYDHAGQPDKDGMRKVMVDYYKSGKPAADKLKSIRFEKSRQKYKSEHDNELRTFYMAERKLKPYFKDGKLPITAWRREREQLEQEYKDIQTELSPLHADAKKLWAIHYNIYEVQHEQERQNTELRQKKQEIEH